ncbi:MAG: hypothetical protein U1A72_05610 [Sulfuritalea sp.]|nr:hypothetical protein [Sulfuritalea sp.]
MLHAVSNRKKNYGPHRPGRCLPPSDECFVCATTTNAARAIIGTPAASCYEFTDLDTLLALAQAA